MALFNKESKEDKAMSKVYGLMERYGLEDMNDVRDIETVKEIALELAGNKLIEFGTALSGKPEDVAKISYLRAIIEQNWIIIRQLDRISKALEK